MVLSSCLLFGVSPLSASKVDTTIRDVFYRGELEQVGNLSVTMTSDDFAAVSPEAPFYLRIGVGHQAELATTLVDLNGENFSAFGQPIHLAMALINPQPGVSLVAPADTLSIVRWVAGEQAIWIRVRHASSGWLSDGEQTMAPSEENPVRWQLGHSARTSYDQFGQVPLDERNLPYNTFNTSTDGDPSQAVSTLICLDLSRSDLDITGVSSLLRLDMRVFDENAENSGLFSDSVENQVDIHFGGDLFVARGRNRLNIVHALDATIEKLQPEQQAAVTNSLHLQLENLAGPNVIPSHLYDGSYLTLSCPPESTFGFPKGGLVLVPPAAAEPCEDPGQPLVEYFDGFPYEGKTLFRQAKLTWNSGFRALEGYLMDIRVTVILTDGLPPELALDWSLSLVSGPGGEDEEPFPYPYQMTACAPAPREVGGGVWTLAQQPRYISFVTWKYSGTTTTILVSNPSSRKANYKFLAYWEDGILLSDSYGSVEPGDSYIFSLGDLFLTESLSHFEIFGDPELQVAALYRSDGEVAALGQFWAESETSRRWLLALGEPALTFDQVAVVNVGQGATDVYARFIDSNGLIVAEKELSMGLATMGKGVFDLTDMLGGFSADTVEVFAGEPLNILALRGERSSKYLWSNQALPLDD